MGSRSGRGGSVMNYSNQTALNAVYALYDEYARTLSAVCRPKCAACCTVNVAITTLEGACILSFVKKTGREYLLTELEKVLLQPRFLPPVTTNQMAQMCLSGQEIPEADNNPAWGRCLFLKDDLCEIYPARPYGCRCMFSAQPCLDTGAAYIDDYSITVNDVYYQAIEHLDQQGFFGNMADVLSFLLCPVPKVEYNPYLLTNYPLAVWMVPPGHQRRIQPILQALRRVI